MYACHQYPQLPELEHFLLWEHSLYSHIFHRCRVFSWCWVFNLQLEQLMKRFLILLLNCPAPGSHLWFYHQLCMWSTHRSLLLRLPWRTQVCCSGDQARRCHSCLSWGRLVVPRVQGSQWPWIQEIWLYLLLSLTSSGRLAMGSHGWFSLLLGSPGWWVGRETLQWWLHSLHLT